MSAHYPQSPAEAYSAVNRRVFESVEIDVAGGTDVVITDTQAQYGVIVFTGALTANISVIVPTEDNRWYCFNETTGAFTLTVKKSGGTGVGVTQSGSASLAYITYFSDVVTLP